MPGYKEPRLVNCAECGSGFLSHHHKQVLCGTACKIRANIVVSDSGCWMWQSKANICGYGQMRVGSKMVVVHRWIFEDKNGPIPEGMVLDHFVCNNRGCVNPDHLRVCTRLENAQRAQMRKDNPSGFKGVVWEPRQNKWRAQIRVVGKLKGLGSFENPTDAARAYDRAALEYFGDSAFTNEMLGKL